MPDRKGVEQQRLHAGLLARLVALAIGGEVTGAGKDGRRIDDDVGVAGGDHGIDPTRRGRQEACLATGRGKQPQAAHLLVVAIVGRAIGIRPR